jgi:hypothetical protein
VVLDAARKSGDFRYVVRNYVSRALTTDDAILPIPAGLPLVSGLTRFDFPAPHPVASTTERGSRSGVRSFRVLVYFIEQRLEVFTFPQRVEVRVLVEFVEPDLRFEKTLFGDFPQ